MDEVLGPEACAALLHARERGPWLEATVNSAQGRVVDSKIRNNRLARVDDPELAQRLLERLRPSLPERLMGTLMVYLNEEFEGGQAAFLDLEQVVEPRRGRALSFQHMVLHEGREVQSGTT